MKNLGIIGWRGMVGSVLMQRMEQEGDLKLFKTKLFSTSQQGAKNISYPDCENTIGDSHNIDELMALDIILTCQGSEYSQEIYPSLKKKGWRGHWIDAASAFRMDEDATIVLDPVNKQRILRDLDNGKKKFIGGNCTVSLMLMALGGLFNEGLVENLISHTYQAASGAGAQAMLELLEQSNIVSSKARETDSALQAVSVSQDILKSGSLPTDSFGAPLAFSLLPWIDSPVENGQSKEEWKAFAEANKILGHPGRVAIDGTCVRVPVLRCHSQALTVKLNKSISTEAAAELIAAHNDWVEIVPNEKSATLERLTPQYVTESLNIPVGRLRKLNLGDNYLNAFSVGDQLLWGAAEPLRRTLRLLETTV